MASHVVIGATGDVGRGIVRALLNAGHDVVAVSRTLPALETFRDELGAPAALSLARGDVSTTDGANALAESICRTAVPDVVICTISAATERVKIADLTQEEVISAFSNNVLPHLEAARAFAPRLAEGATYLGLGGGMADATIPGFAHVSMAQAAQRMLFRHMATDKGFAHLRVIELLIHSMVAGRSKAGTAQPDWVTDDDIGAHVLAVLNRPQDFPGPILSLKSRKQAGSPERQTA